jgi:hypothetical protein
MTAARSNSVVYATTTAYKYYATVVTDDFFQGADWTASILTPSYYQDANSTASSHMPLAGGGILSTEWRTWLEDAQKGRPLQIRPPTRPMLTTGAGEIQLTKLDNKACVQTYTAPFVTQNGNLILTVDHHNSNTSNHFNSSLLAVIQAGYNNGQNQKSHAGTSYGWMCAKNAFEAARDTPNSPRCNNILGDPSSFVLHESMPVKDGSTSSSYHYMERDLPVNACYTQQMEESCTVEASVTLLGIVITFITCKTLCMLWILLRLKETPLAVPGDAIASFMTGPDDYTKDACLAPSSAFTHTVFWQVKREWSPKPKRWKNNVSGGQWITCIFTYDLPYPQCALH